MAQNKVSEPPPQKVEIVGERDGISQQSDTAGKIVLPRAEILKFGDAALVDVLRRQSGISIVGTEIRLRGLGNGYTQILLNGDPVPTGFNLSSLSPESIERIEIIKSGTVEYSTQAIAGSINFILRKNVTRGRKEIKLGIIKFASDVTPNIAFDLADKDGKFSYLLTGNANRGHNEGDPVTTETLRNRGDVTTLREFREHFDHDSTRINLAPRLNWTLANSDQITSQSLLFFNNLKLTGVVRETTFLGQPTDYQTNSSAVKVRILGLRSDINWTHRLNDSTKLNSKIGVYYSDRNRNQFFYGNAAPGSLPFVRNIIYDTTDRNWVAAGKLQLNFNDRHALVLGWDGGLVRGIERRKQNDRDIFGNATDLPREDFSAQIRRLALFAQDEWDVNKNLQVYLGLRWEGLRTVIDGNFVESTNKSSAVFSPVLQTLWIVPGTAKDKLRLALSRTYKAPEPRDLAPYRQTVNNNNGPNNPDYQGNPGLLPELASALDFGYEHNFAEKAVIGLSGSVRRVKNVKLDRLFFENGVWISSKANQGGAVAYGLGLEAKFPLRQFWKQAPAINLAFNAARNWSRLDNVPGPDNRLADQVPVTVNAAIDYEPPGGHKIGMNFNFQNGGNIQISDTESRYRNVTRTLDIYGVWKIDQATRLRLSLGNALHQVSVAQQSFQTNDGSSNIRSTATPTHYTFRITLEHSL